MSFELTRLTDIAFACFSSFCYLALGVYSSATVWLILRPQDLENRFREALSVLYCGLAAYYSLGAIKALVPLRQQVVETLGYINGVELWMSQVAMLAGMAVGCAFICNFSRSLLMLKRLDHGDYPVVPNWSELSNDLHKRVFEFAPRVFAAVWFLKIESAFAALAAVQDESRNLASSGLGIQQAISDAGKMGIPLYLSLLVWWGVGRWMAGSAMPKTQFFFYVAGLVNSGFLLLFSQRATGASFAVGLVFCTAFAMGSALYMLGLVGYDVYQILRRVGHRTAEVLGFGPIVDLLPPGPPAVSST